jgi:hypothetical protein
MTGVSWGTDATWNGCKKQHAYGIVQHSMFIFIYLIFKDNAHDCRCCAPVHCHLQRTRQLYGLLNTTNKQNKNMVLLIFCKYGMVCACDRVAR